MSRALCTAGGGAGAGGGSAGKQRQIAAPSSRHCLNTSTHAQTVTLYGGKRVGAKVWAYSYSSGACYVVSKECRHGRGEREKELGLS